jgi:3-oxoacyl-[acyl-carrier-protein] synthase II
VTSEAAITGLALRAPGGISDAGSFWAAIERGADLTGTLPEDRRAADPRGWADLPTRGGYLSEVFGFDPRFFGISPREARSIDPQHRLLLELIWEAFENAAIRPGDCGPATGVFVGITGSDYREWGDDQLSSYWTIGNGHCFSVGRVARTLDLGGPALAVDTACSSSLVAVHTAARALAAGDCDVAIAAGVNLVLSARTTRGVSLTGALSPDGRSRPFDARANGFVRAEGGGAVVLKRLADARRDHDRVLAVLEATALNQDGRCGSFAAPNEHAQVRLLRSLLDRAGRRPDDITLVEAHATGTPVGDPVEVAAALRVLAAGERDRPLLLGSVKGNIGHAESAAGVLSLIKAVACLNRRQVPPQANLEQLNPAIDLAGRRAAIPTELTRLPEGELHAIVSSFGLSGTNAGAVLSAPDGSPAAAGRAGAVGAELPAGTGFLVSAATPAALRRLAGQYATALAALDPAQFPAFLHTSTFGRSVQRCAVWAAARTVPAALAALGALAAGEGSPALRPLADGQPVPAGGPAERLVIDLPCYPWERAPYVVR